MRAVVQRVVHASVVVDGAEVSRIGPGLLVLLGIAAGDDQGTADRMADRISKLRIFDDDSGRLGEALDGREVLCVSQFTLLADTDKGNRPSFTAAAEPGPAEELYERVCERLDAEKGVFGASMQVGMLGDGPVTIVLEN